MNIEKNLILIKGDDKTEQVIYCKSNNGMRNVTFKNEKTYKYSYDNVRWITNPIEFNPETIIVYEKNVPIIRNNKNIAI